MKFIRLPDRKTVGFRRLLAPNDGACCAEIVAAAFGGGQEAGGSKLTSVQIRAASHKLETFGAEQAAIGELANSAEEDEWSNIEKLRVSREELHLLNKELNALNFQLQETLERHRTTTNDLQNVLYSTGVATIFLDTQFKIRLFTPAITALFNLVPGDLGRPLTDLKSLAPDGCLLPDARWVLETQSPLAREIAGQAGAWFTRRILPYRTSDGKTEGVVITFVDVPERRSAAEAASAAQHRAGQASPQFVEAHAVQSAPGKNSAFSVGKPPVQRPASVRSTSGKCRVFVVDDDVGVRGAISAVLESEGYTIAAFESCEAFLDAFHLEKDACLVIDAYLPGMSGLELLEKLRTEGRQLPAIMITGASDVALAVKAMKAGASDFIEKPVGRRELVASLDRALELSQDSNKFVERRESALSHLEGLTPRQVQVMQMVLAGQPSKNIAADLGLSQRTIENHRMRIMKRTGSKSLPALARLALIAAGGERPHLPLSQLRRVAAVTAARA